jgi:tetratricopeptide (TPR) repeat protein
LSRRAQALMPDDAFDARRVVSFLLRLDRPGEAATAIADFAHRQSDGLSALDASSLYRVAHGLAGQPRVQADFLQLLLDAQWDDPTEDSSSLWYDLALARVRLHEPERARAAIVRVIAPEYVIRLRDDKRFDALVDRDAPAFDAKAAAQRTVAALRDKAERLPRSLAVRRALATALLHAGDLQAVLDLSEQTRKAIADAGDAPPYDDPDQLTWMLDTRAIALRRLGRIDEAVALMERIRDDPENGRPNISQAINLGMFHCQIGRPRDALAGLARIDDAGMSDYGRTQFASVRLYAAVALGDRALQRTAFDFIRAHRADSQATWLDALLLLGRVDDAAKRYIERLASEDERADALFELQDTVRPEPLPGDRPAVASRRAVLARADVRAAIERVGRVEHHDVSVDYAF